MTAQEFKENFSQLTEENKNIVRDHCIAEMPVSRSSFYRKLEQCTWSNAELYFIQGTISFNIYNEKGKIKTIKN